MRKLKVKTARLLHSLVLGLLSYKNLREKLGPKMVGGGTEWSIKITENSEAVNHFYCSYLGASEESYLMVI